MKTDERRRRRSENVTEALIYQLDIARRSSGLRGLLVTDKDGMCIAAAGDTDACDEVAARAPLVGNKASEFDGTLLSAQTALPIRLKRFVVKQVELYMCAIGGDESRRSTSVSRCIGGATRILSATVV